MQNRPWRFVSGIYFLDCAIIIAAQTYSQCIAVVIEVVDFNEMASVLQRWLNPYLAIAEAGWVI